MKLGGPIPLSPVQQTSQLVAHIDDHDLFARTSQVSDLVLDGLGNAGVDGATQSTVRGHTNDQMLAGLVLGSLYIGLLVQCWRERRCLLAAGFTS